MDKKKKNRLVKFFILAVIILLIFFYYLGVLFKGENYFIGFFSDLQNDSYTFFTKLKYSFINYQEAQQLKTENDQLKQELNQLSYENSQLVGYKLENDKLRSMLNFFEEQNFDYVMGKVIGRDLNRVNTLIINKGKNDGIQAGYAAVVDQGVIIGKVAEVKDNLLTILLLTDQASQLAVSTLSSNETTGLAKGEFGLSIKVDLIPQDIGIRQDDLLITSGLEKFIPRGLILGKVNRIISQENDLFKSATINPLVDYNQITILSIIIPKDYTND